MRKLKYDAVRAQEDSTLEVWRSHLVALEQAGHVLPFGVTAKTFNFSNDDQLTWLLGACLDGIVCSSLPKAQQASAASMCLMQPAMLRKAVVFVMDPELIAEIIDADMKLMAGSTIKAPFDHVFIEPSRQMISPFNDRGSYLQGLFFSHFKHAVRLPDMPATVCPLSFDQLLLCDFYCSATTGKLYQGGHHFPAVALERVNEDGSLDVEGFEVIAARADATHHVYTTIESEESGRKKKKDTSKIFTRLLTYLSSSNVEYTLQTRRYEGSSRQKRRQQLKPYYVTKLTRSARVRLSTKAAGTGEQLQQQVRVRAHAFRRWYCPNCERIAGVAKFLEHKVCEECYEQLDLAVAKIKHFWQPAHWKGPDAAEQVHRHFYRAKYSDG